MWGELLVLLFVPILLAGSPIDTYGASKGAGDSAQKGMNVSAPSAGGKSVSRQSPRNANGVFLSLYREQYQNAFSLLIPKGWKAEGGMVPSGVQWNVVDLVENNIKFRVTSQDGKSFFGWYPRFYFQDPSITTRSSGGTLQMRPGQVINGVWQYPYMGIEQYVQYIVFGQFAAREFQNPRILGKAQPSPELKPWVPQVASHYQAGYVNFECAVNGVPTFGRIYTIIYNIQNVLWTTVGTWGLAAPKSRWPEDERVMEICLRSFRLNPEWISRASAAERQRGQQYNETIRHMSRVDQEIQKNRAQTSSDIMHENYKVLTGQIEARDPSTGKVKYLPSYNNAYTDGRGNYFLKDYDDGTLPFDNASEWRKMDIVNRLDRGSGGRNR
jgi:hypothetical protein